MFNEEGGNTVRIYSNQAHWVIKINPEVCDQGGHRSTNEPTFECHSAGSVEVGETALHGQREVNSSGVGALYAGLGMSRQGWRGSEVLRRILQSGGARAELKTVEGILSGEASGSQTGCVCRLLLTFFWKGRS